MPANRSYDFENLTDRPPTGRRTRTSLDAAAYDDSRETKWRCVRNSGSNESSRLRMISPSEAVCAETLAPKCPTILSKPASNRDGQIRYRRGEAFTWASPESVFVSTGKFLAGKFFFRNLSFSLGRRTPMPQLHAITQPPSSHLRHRHHPPADPHVRDCSNSHYAAQWDELAW
eukprot:1048299-Prymnesium_polylepis.1